MTKRASGTNSAFYTRTQLLDILPFGRTTLFNMIKIGEFPKPKNLGARAVAWSKKEVDEWINQKLTS